MEPAGYVIFADVCRLLNLPNKETIVGQCQANPNARGMLLDLKIPDATPAWVKYGLSVTMGEAHTQDVVWKTFDAKPDSRVRVAKVYQAFQVNGVGYIVMEYINGVACEKSDIKQVAAAVKCLTGLRSRTPTPGPVGGGPIKHHFFVDWDSSVTYCTALSNSWKITSIMYVCITPLASCWLKEMTDPQKSRSTRPYKLQRRSQIRWSTSLPLRHLQW
jgi:hypothetical protein